MPPRALVKISSAMLVPGRDDQDWGDPAEAQCARCGGRQAVERGVAHGAHNVRVPHGAGGHQVLSYQRRARLVAA
jgi:hypothetical protein